MDNKNEIAMIKNIGARLREARELTRYSIKDAAELMGLQAESLRQIESGVDSESIPLHVIQQAAKIYDVSVDFLFNMNDDWEVAQEVRRERDFLVHIQTKLAEDQAKIAARLLNQQAQINALTAAVESLVPAIQAINDAITQFQQVNPELVSMPTGSPVLLSVSKAKYTAQQAVIAMVRQNLLPVEMLSTYTTP